MASEFDTTKLYSENGSPVADNNHTLTAGERGPMMLQDNWMIEKLAHFDREVIPERRMHAKGSGAYGTFKVTGDISKYTKAKVFQPGAETEVFVRFSTVAGERGAADAERDIRGFAMKFYTPDGNWDLVGNNTPVFFLRDPKKFIDLNHVVKRDPHTNMHSAQSNWDFWSSLPEALHQVTIVMSDRGIPASYRHMHGFGSHTYSLINEQSERVWVKFHLKTNQGIKNLTDDEAAQIIAGDRESHQRDLFGAIERGEFPSWRFCIQVMDEATAKNYKENPFDITKTWSQKEFPLIEVGTLELNRNPENYFAEVEQAAKLAGAHEFISALHSGYDTYVGERGVKLSGGQKQRISIARVFLKNPPILILDEATSALDNESEHLVGQSLARLAQGRTTLTIAHRLTTIQHADRILVLGENGIEEEGTHEELLAKHGVYHKLWTGAAALDKPMM